ncbi:hypothetical protein KAS41_00980 [Candidatus Parcubacteria bacterium]|nr:hypothetical protein [Candidatus Parcubacteria bacterium]
MTYNIEKLAYKWISDSNDKVDADSEYYCSTRDIFQSRLDKMIVCLLKNHQIKEENIYIAAAIAGEIGNNSFDHNLGSWPDIIGIFFAYEIIDNKLKICLADRGQGVLKTLKRVKPELKDDLGALHTAFTEKISGRAPENRGNGLKFVRINTKSFGINMDFYSGNAIAKLNSKMIIKKTDKYFQGCLTIIRL